MGFRFRKSFKILPGIKINLSKSGISTSIGVPGATVNLRGDKTTTTVGLPGTGISYRETSSGESAQETRSGGMGSLLLVALVIAFVAWIVL